MFARIQFIDCFAMDTLAFSRPFALPFLLNPAMPQHFILILEDDPSLAELLVICLRERGYAVAAASALGEATQIIEENPPDLVLLDLTLRDSIAPKDTIKKIPALKEVAQNAPIIVITAHTDADLITAATDNGAAGFLFKPDMAKEELLFKTIATAIEHKRHYDSAAKAADDLEKTEEKIKRLTNGN